MAKQSQGARLAELLGKTDLTEQEFHEIAGMTVARNAIFAPGVVLPSAAFAIPGKADQVVLKSTDVSSRHLTDLSRWPTLQYLTLEDCRVDEAALSELAAVPKLKALGLQGTNLTDAGLAHVGQLTNLAYLDVARTHVTDAGMVNVGWLVNLESLTIGQNRITDVGLSPLTGLKKLKVLWLNETGVTDAGLLQLAVLPRLTSLNIQKSSATDAGKEALVDAQLALKRPAKPAKAAAPDDSRDPERIKATFVAFADAMFQWEQSYWANRSMWNTATEVERDWLDQDLKDTCRAVFARHCTDKPRPGFRPDALSCADPSDYDPKRRQIESAELDTATRAFVYAKNPYGRLRYTLLREGDHWLVDACHRFSGGRWTNDGL